VSPFSLIRYLTEHSIVKVVKQILGENLVKPVLQRLVRLTREEARSSPAQTLEVIYSLVQIMTVAMNGEKTHTL
jgi:hypothetical protein